VGRNASRNGEHVEKAVGSGGKYMGVRRVPSRRL